MKKNVFDNRLRKLDTHLQLSGYYAKINHVCMKFVASDRLRASCCGKLVELEDDTRRINTGLFHKLNHLGKYKVFLMG